MSSQRGASYTGRREFSYTGFATAEARGPNRAAAIDFAFRFMDAHSSGRRRPAAQRYEVYRVRKLGRGCWVVYYRRRRRP